MAADLQQLPGIARGFGRRARLVGLGLVLSATLAHAQNVSLAGRMGERALLVIDGQPRALAVGDSAGGVRLLRWVGSDGDRVEVEVKGATSQLRLGSTPAQLGAAVPRTGARTIVMTAGPGGHFVSSGAINGKPALFMVDTGATLVSLGRDDAQRMGIDLSAARRVMTRTANGDVVAQVVMLNSVRVGEVELHNVGAVIVPQPMPMVLLGNSFLSRLQMRRDNDVMRLELR